MMKVGNFSPENSLYIEIIKKKTLLLNQKSELEQKLKNIKSSFAGNKHLREDYLNEINTIEGTIEGMYNLEINSHHHICPLCSTSIKSPLESSESSQVTIDRLNKNIKEIKDKLELIDYLSISKKQEIKLIENKIDNLNENIYEIQNKESIYIQSTEIPILNEIELLNESLRKEEEKEQKIKMKVEYYNLVRKIQNKNEVLKLQKEILKKSLQTCIEQKKHVLESLNKFFENDLSRFTSLNQNLGEINNDYLPCYNGSTILKHTSGGLLSALSIVFLGTLSKFSSQHPKILMLDTIGKYLGTQNKSEIKDRQMYEEIYTYIKDLSSNLQIILVDNTPPQTMDKYIKYTFHQGIHNGLINLTLNEKII